MLTFIGVGRIKTEKLDAVTEAIRKYVASIGNEAGTPEYIVYQDRKDPCKIVFYERYRDEQTYYDEHRKNPALKEMMDVLFESMDGEADMGFYEVLAQKE